MDLDRKHVVITGATSGIGRSSALILAGLGADLTLLNRNPARAEALAADIIEAGGSRPTLVSMDMAELQSVRDAAGQCLSLGKPIHVLLNNAGLINTRRRETTDGYEETLAVNHFAPFLLTGLLLPALLQTPGSRIVNVASDAHHFVKGMGFDDMQAQDGYRMFREYGRSKLANILFTRSLAQRLADQPITVNCLHPGAVATSLGSQNSSVLTTLLSPLLKLFFRSPDKGAETSIYLCRSDEVARVSGAYFANCRQVTPRPWARDDEAASRLWQLTEQCVGFHYPEPAAVDPAGG